MHTVPSTSLRILQSQLSQAVFSACRRQVLLVGPEGRGKTTLLKSFIKQHNRDHTFCYYDFQVNANHNFQVMLMQWSSSLISQNPLLKGVESAHCTYAFDNVTEVIAETYNHVNIFIKRILSHKKLNERLSSHLERIISGNIEINGSTWFDTCKLLRLHAPWTMGIKDPSTINDIEAFYYGIVALGIIAEKVELEQCCEAHPSSALTGKWVTSYLFNIYNNLSQQLKTGWVLCLDGVDQLCRSPFLNDRGTAFLGQMLSALQTNKHRSVLISDSSIPFVKLVDEKLHNRLNDVYMQAPELRSGSTIDPSALVFLDVPEIESSLSISLLREKIWNCDNIARALHKVSGGNMALLSKVITSYRNLEESMDLPAVQQILAGSQCPVDDEYFPFKESLEDQTRYLQEERCKIFVRNLHNAALKEEVGRFESLMNQFLSLPLMESIKKNLGNPIHFWVTLSETIRYMLSKPLLQLKPGVTIENKVILALIASGIVHLNLFSRTLEFKNSLTRLLLETYINHEYEKLTWIQQVEYKANYLLNQKTIYRDLDQLLL